MSWQRPTFDQVVYILFAAPLLGGFSYGICYSAIMMFFMRVSVRIERLTNYSGGANRSFIMLVFAVIAILPAWHMAKKLFLAGWPARKPEK